jgi:hypothetical protein
MLLSQFILQNIHFDLNVLASLVFFSVSWLYLDAYLTSKSKKELYKIVGFLLISISFLFSATYIEQASLNSQVIGGNLIRIFTEIVRVVGYSLLVLGLIFDPLQKKPVYKKEQQETKTYYGLMFLEGLPKVLFAFISPLLSFIIFIFYLRRYSTGLEKHFKSLTIGFFFIFLYEVLSLTSIFENTNSIYIYEAIHPFGLVWMLGNILFFIGICIIARWVFGYLLKRIQTQMFMILNISLLIIFLITTLSFTGILLSNLRNDAFSHLETDVSVVNYAIKTKQSQTLSDAELLAQNPGIVEGVSKKDKKALKDLTTSILLAKNESYLIIVSSSGGVLMRGEDNEKIGDSLSSDPLFIKAARGEKVSSLTSNDGAIAPIISVKSAAPITSNGNIIGVAIVGIDIDNAFVDGLKSSTKLDVSVYGGNTLSATTFIAEDGKSRFIGIKEKNDAIRRNVLIEGKNYSSETNILNTPYLAIFSPVKDIDGNPVGMLFVGKQQSSLIQSASRSIEYTFMIAVFLMLISIIPCYLISRFISNQFK